MKYANMNWGRMEAIINKLGGEAGADDFLAGKTVVGKPGTVTKLKSSASPKVLAGLLEPVGEPVKLVAANHFVAREKFIVNVNGELPISASATTSRPISWMLSKRV